MNVCESAGGRRVLALGLLLLSLMPVGCAAEQPPPGLTELPSPLPGRRVYLAPLGDFPADDVQALAVYFHERYDVRIDVLRGIGIPRDAIDEDRRQLEAEDLIAGLVRGHPDVAARDGAIIMGLIEEDLYIRAVPDWSWAFNYRTDDRFAVTSRARMATLGADEETVMTRLKKMLTKNIGLLYFGLSTSDDPRSAMYRDILSVGDLDVMSDDLLIRG